MKVAVVGLGRMGLPVARHIHAAGHDLVSYDVSEQARQRAREAGLTVVDSLPGLGGAQVVCSSLPDTPQVHSVYAGGVFGTVNPGTVCVDLSTISVAGSQALARRAADRGLAFLDAPVSGTSIHAEAGTLVVMVGGDRHALDRARPALDPIAAHVTHVGDNGAGLQLKLITNRLLTTNLAAIAQAVLELEAVGLDVEQGLDLIRSGAVPRLLDYKSAPLAERDFTPQFTVDLMRKDLRLAAEALPPGRLSDVSQRILEETAAAGHGSDDLAALITAVAQHDS